MGRSIAKGLVIQNNNTGLLLSFSLAAIHRWTQKSWWKLNLSKNEITLQVKDFAALRLRDTMIDKMQQRMMLWITLLYIPWKGLTLWSKQSISRNNVSMNPYKVYPYKVLTEVCTISSLTEVLHRIAHVLVQMTRSTLVPSWYLTNMLELPTSNTCIIPNVSYNRRNKVQALLQSAK